MTEEMTRDDARRAHDEIVKNFSDEPRLRDALRRPARHLAYDDLGRLQIATWETT